MSLTIRPTVYELVLACGHVQLASRPLPVGHGYPCWTACDSERVTPGTVAEVHRHEEQAGETIVVCSGVSNGDMLHVQRVVDEANTKPSGVSSTSALLPKIELDYVLLTLALLPADEADAYLAEIPAKAAVKLLQGVEDLIAESSNEAPELRRLAAAVKTRFDI